MNGGRCSTTRIWRPPSSTASWSADGSFASMDPRDELVISSSRTPCQAVPNGSEYLEYVAQNFRNPQFQIPGFFVELGMIGSKTVFPHPARDESGNTSYKPYRHAVAAENAGNSKSRSHCRSDRVRREEVSPPP